MCMGLPLECMEVIKNYEYHEYLRDLTRLIKDEFRREMYLTLPPYLRVL